MTKKENARLEFIKLKQSIMKNKLKKEKNMLEVKKILNIPEVMKYIELERENTELSEKILDEEEKAIWMEMGCCNHLMCISGRAPIDIEMRRHTYYGCVKCGLTNRFEESLVTNNYTLSMNNMYAKQFPYGYPNADFISDETVIDGNRLYKQAFDLTQSDDNKLLVEAILSLIEQEKIDNSVASGARIKG